MKLKLLEDIVIVHLDETENFTNERPALWLAIIKMLNTLE